MYATHSWSTPLPSYDTVLKPESLWQPYNMQQYNHEVETIDQLRHLGTFGMKPPYRFGMHEHDPLATEYIKLEPSVLTISSSAMAGQRGNHVFFRERHAAVVTNTNAAITELSKTINIDSWGRTALCHYDSMRSAPDTSFDEHGNADGKPSYQWYTKIKVACQNCLKNLSRDRSIIQHFIHTTGIGCFSSIHRLQCDCDCGSRDNALLLIEAIKPGVIRTVELEFVNFYHQQMM